MRLKLKFCGADNPELCESHFNHPLLTQTRSTARGKAGGAFYTYGSFQWTKAVKAVAILAIRAKISQLSNAVMNPFISGEASSLAASLDYAIQKEPAWVLDIFGVDSNGTALVRRVFHRSNPGRKRVGPVAVSWNSLFISPKDIEIIWEEVSVNKIEQLNKLLQHIEDKISGDTNREAPIGNTFELMVA